MIMNEKKSSHESLTIFAARKSFDDEFNLGNLGNNP